MINIVVFVALQAIPPITPVDVGGAIRQYQDQQRIRIQRDNADTYATQTEMLAQSTKGEQDDAEMARAQDVMVGRLIVEGRCADARRVALGEGRFDLVDRVTSLCVSPQPE